MNKQILFAILLLTVLRAEAQIADDNLREADSALSIGWCYGAGQALMQVNLNEQEKPNYIHMMARLHECRGNYELAKEMYKKYLETQPRDESAKRSLEHVDSMINFSELMKTVKQKDFQRRNGWHVEFSVNQSYVFGTGYMPCYSAASAFRLSIFHTRFKRRLYLDGNINIGLYTWHNKEWYASALDVPVYHILSIGPGLSFEGCLTPSYFIYKKPKNAVSIGGIIGLSSLIPVGYDINNSSKTYHLYPPSFGSGITGVRLKYFRDNSVSCYLEYRRFLITQTKTTRIINYEYTDVYTPVDMNMITLGIGIMKRKSYK